MVQKSIAKRGRPLSFDPGEALGQVRDVFWNAGFAATSLDHLSAATGLNRPSLYGAFGDKRALYARVLDEYRAMARAAMTRALDPALPLREGLMRMYQGALALYLPRDRSARGCFMIGTAVTEAVVDDETREGLAAGLREIEKALSERFRLAQESGEATAEADPAALASMAAAAMYTIAIKARAGEPRRALEAIAQAAIDLTCGGKARRATGSARRK